MTLRRRNPAALDNPKVSVVIPVYNEKDTILEILGRVLATDMTKEVIIVDDGSKDGTREILEKMAAMQAKGEATMAGREGTDVISLRDLKFFFQNPNQGKGAAMRRGFSEATDAHNMRE